MHAQKVWDVFEIRNLGEYHNLYAPADTSLLADVFENFRNMCLEKYQLDPSHFLSAPGLAWQACLKKTNVNLELLTDVDLDVDQSRFNEDFIKNYNQNSDIGYFLEVDIEYLEQLWSSHKDLPFLPEKKNRKSRTCLWYRRQRKIHHSHKSFKTSTKSWINTKRCA